MEKIMLKGKTIIVTGTARGMGKKMAELFAENGANVIAHARIFSKEHTELCEELSERFGVKVIPIYFDLIDEQSLKEGIKDIRNYKLPIDGLVNNAGISHTSLIQMTKMEDLRHVFENNFFSHYNLTQYVIKLMQRNGGGSIVSISSSSALDMNPGLSAYACSKSALLCMTTTISRELANSGIRANTICPGVTATDMIATMNESIYEIQKKSAALSKIATVDDIANTALFLLSDLSKYITGQVIRVDGGVSEYDKR